MAEILSQYRIHEQTMALIPAAKLGLQYNGYRTETTHLCSADTNGVVEAILPRTQRYL